MSNNPCGSVATLLIASEFEYSEQLPPEAFEIELSDYCEIEEYLGWEIQSEPVFAVIHVNTGHTWRPRFVELEDVARIKTLIRKGFEMDLEKAMGVGK